MAKAELLMSDACQVYRRTEPGGIAPCAEKSGVDAGGLGGQITSRAGHIDNRINGGLTVMTRQAGQRIGPRLRDRLGHGRGIQRAVDLIGRGNDGAIP